MPGRRKIAGQDDLDDKDKVEDWRLGPEIDWAEKKRQDKKGCWSPDESASAKTPLPMPPEETLPFISPDLKEGEPSCNWESIKKPQLKRFAKSDSAFQWVEYLGHGVDGMAIKAKVDGNEVVVKIFWDAAQREPENGRHYYWAFERECCNCAVLESVTTSLQRSLDAGKQIYVNPRPKTMLDARRNLKAFSTEFSGRRCRPGFVPFTLRTEVNQCLGWTKVDRRDFASFLRRSRTRESPRYRLPENKTSFAIVYQYVPMGELDREVMQTQLDFFYLLGFMSVSMNLDNWRSAGVLVDFSDLIFPYDISWEQWGFGKKVYWEEHDHWGMEMPNFPHQKRWPSEQGAALE